MSDGELSPIAVITCRVGHQVSAADRFCPQCGDPIADADSTAAPSRAEFIQPAPPPPQSFAPGPILPSSPLPVAMNGFAVAALVLGIVWLGGVGSLLAIIFGFIALSQIKRRRGQQSGRGLAIAGVVLGFVGVVAFVGMISLVAFVGHTADAKFQSVGSDLSSAPSGSVGSDGYQSGTNSYGQACNDDPASPLPAC